MNYVPLLINCCSPGDIYDSIDSGPETLLALMVTFAFDHSVKSQGIREISVTMLDSSKQKFYRKRKVI